MQPSKQGNKLNLIANPSKPSTTRILFTSAFTYTSTCYEIFIDSLCLLLARGAGHKALLWCLKLWLDHYERFHIMAHQGSPTDMTMMTCKDPEGTRGKACYWFEIFQKTSKYVQMCGELCFLWDIALKPHHKGIALFAHQVHLAFNEDQLCCGSRGSGQHKAISNTSGRNTYLMHLLFVWAGQRDAKETKIPWLFAPVELCTRGQESLPQLCALKNTHDLHEKQGTNEQHLSFLIILDVCLMFLFFFVFDVSWRLYTFVGCLLFQAFNKQHISQAEFWPGTRWWDNHI